MIQRAEQANIVGLRSKDFVQWVEENIDAPIKRGPGGAILERLKAGLVGGVFQRGERDPPWPVDFGIIWCAIEVAPAPGSPDGIERFGGIFRPSPRPGGVPPLKGPNLPQPPPPG